MPNKTKLSASKSLLAAAKQAGTDERREAIMSAEQKKPEPKPTSLSPESIAEAWSLISPAGHSVLTKSQLLDSLKSMFPNISAKDVRALVGTGNMSVDKLKHLLLHSDVPPLDENAEAFKLLDVDGSGFIDASVLKKLLQTIHGMEQVNEADMALVLQLCDADKDGKISMQDFATIGSWAPIKETPTETTRKLMLEKLKAAQGVRPRDEY